MKKYVAIDEYKSEKIVENDWTTNKDTNPLIVETAGFIPLEVKFKRFEQNGIRAQFFASEFTSSDYRDMYLSPDLSINLGDDLEDVQMKFELQEQRRNEILQRINKSLVDNLSEERSDEEKLSTGESNHQKVSNEKIEVDN